MASIILNKKGYQLNDNLLIIGNKTSVKNTIHQETKGYPLHEVL